MYLSFNVPVHFKAIGVLPQELLKVPPILCWLGYKALFHYQLFNVESRVNVTPLYARAGKLKNPIIKNHRRKLVKSSG